MGKLKAAYRSLSIRKKLFVCIALVSLVPQCLLVAKFFQTSKDALTETTQASIHQLVLVNNELIGEQLSAVRDATMSILVDSELYAIFGSADAGGKSRTDVEREIRDVLTKYFGSLPCVEQVDIITRAYSYPLKEDRLSQYREFFDSDQYLAIAERSGGILWLTKDDMSEYSLGAPLLSCARLLNLRYVPKNSYVGVPLPSGSERPVIHVQFSDSFFSGRLSKNTANLHGAEYALVDEQGRALISGGDYEGFEMRPEWWDEIRERGSGMLRVEGASGAQTVICFDRLERSGWTSIAAFSVEALAGGMIGSMSRTFVVVVCVQALTSLMATLLAISMITRRIRQLDLGVDALKAGNFQTVIEDDHTDEFTYLVENFNGMSRTLRQLIDENYKVRLSEQEARLQTLMMQLNPHYLYNTLNVINWVALRGDTKRTSALIVSLSRMLRYTSDNRQACTPLNGDVEWLQRYLTLMEVRFEGLFSVSWRVDEDCLSCELPKLFMQPLLENSILHGFSGRNSGGEIQIRIWRAGGDVLCEVEDNGVGMTGERIAQVLGEEGTSIGLYNIHKRIRLMYGDDYGLSIVSAPGQGSTVRVKMRA